MVLFFILQLANVILATMRSILTVKASRHVAAIFNAVSYTFYNAIVKLMTGQDMAVILITTFVTNIIGVYAANFILDKFKKDKLWKVEFTLEDTPENEKIVVNLREQGISCNYIYAGKYLLVNCYCPTQAESQVVKDVLSTIKAKYFVSETKSL